MPRVAHDLFELAAGASELPSDQNIVRKIEKQIDTIIERIRPLDSDSKLALVRRMMRGANSTSRIFNAAVFIADKEPQVEEQELPLAQTPTEEGPVW